MSKNKENNAKSCKATKWFGLLVSLLVVVGAAHGALWHFSAKYIETLLRNNLDLNHLQEDGTDVSTSYTLKRFGYPLSLGFTLQNYEATVVKAEENIDWAISMDGESTFVFTAMQPKVYTGTIHNANIQTKANLTGQGMETIRTTAVKTIFTGHLTDTDNYNFQTEGLSIYRENSEEAFVTLAHLNAEGKQTDPSGSMQSSSFKMQAEGLSVVDKEAGKTIHIPSIKTDISATAWPNPENLEEVLADLATQPKEVLQAPASAPIQRLKTTLKSYADAMVNAGSTFDINQLAIEGTDFGLEIESHLKVVSNGLLQGDVKAKLQNMGEFTPDVSENNPLLAMFLSSEGDIEIAASIQNGLIYINNIPLLRTPSLYELVEIVPEKYFASIQEETEQNQ